MVYLIHFAEPFQHAQHYLGFCENGNLETRLERHRHGNGSALLRAVTAAGIEWEVVRTWPDGDRNFERQLKQRRDAKILCPHCRAARLAYKRDWKRAKYQSQRR